MTVYLLFLRYDPIDLIKCIHGIHITEAIEENTQPLQEYVNALHKHEEAVQRMLNIAAMTSKEEEDVTKAYTVIEPSGINKKLKDQDLGNIGTSKGAITTDW